MRCRRCGCSRLIRLEKRHEEDNIVLRCGECGFIFSPLDVNASAPKAAIGPGNVP